MGENLVRWLSNNQMKFKPRQMLKEVMKNLTLSQK